MNPMRTSADQNGEQPDRPLNLAALFMRFRANFLARNRARSEPLNREGALPVPLNPVGVLQVPYPPYFNYPRHAAIHRRAAAGRIPDVIIDLSGPDEERPHAARGRWGIAEAIFGNRGAQIDGAQAVRRSERIAQLVRNAVPQAEAEVENVRQGSRRHRAENGNEVDDQNQAGPPSKRPRQDGEEDTMERGYTCPICNSCVSYRRPVATRCGHVFCRGCIDQALKNNKKCPICNGKVKEGRYIRIYI